MIQNMESAAYDTIAAALKNTPPLPPARRARPEAQTIIDGMAQIMVDLTHAGVATTRQDMLNRGYSPGEIDEYGSRAGRRARAAIEEIAARGIRRARVPAARPSPAAV